MSTSCGFGLQTYMCIYKSVYNSGNTGYNCANAVYKPVNCSELRYIRERRIYLNCVS